jgi:hypothetical protein
VASHRGGPRFTPGSIHVRFLVDNVAVGQVFLEFFIFPLLILISLPHEVCNRPDQAAYYHTLGPKLGASSLYQHFAGTEETRRRD